MSGTYHTYFAYYICTYINLVSSILVIQPTEVVKIILEIDDEKIAHEKVVNCVTNCLIESIQQVDQHVSYNVLSYNHKYMFVLHMYFFNIGMKLNKYVGIMLDLCKLP